MIRRDVTTVLLMIAASSCADKFVTEGSGHALGFHTQAVCQDLENQASKAYGEALERGAPQCEKDADCRPFKRPNPRCWSTCQPTVVVGSRAYEASVAAALKDDQVDSACQEFEAQECTVLPTSCPDVEYEPSWFDHCVRGVCEKAGSPDEASGATKGDVVVCQELANQASSAYGLVLEGSGVPQCETNADCKVFERPQPLCWDTCQPLLMVGSDAYEAQMRESGTSAQVVEPCERFESLDCDLVPVSCPFVEYDSSSLTICANGRCQSENP
jgi:hypothetical protein